MSSPLLAFLRSGRAPRPNGRVRFATVGLPAPPVVERARSVVPVQPLEPLPRRLYHGTALPERLLTEGLALPPAKDVAGEKSGGSYDWTLWRPYVWEWFRSLPPGARAALANRAGRELRTPDDLGEAVSLLWTAEDPRIAARYSGGLSLELDPRKLPLFGFFDDPLEVGGSRVLVLPARGFQGGPEAFVSAYRRSPGAPMRGREPALSRANLDYFSAQFADAIRRSSG